MRHRFQSWPRVIFFLVMTLLITYGVVRALRTTSYTDFDVYYTAGKHFQEVLLGQETEGFRFDPTDSSPFRYAPLFGWLFIPFSWFPLNIARAIWVFFQGLCYFFSIQMVSRRFQLSDWTRLILVLGTLRFANDNSNIAQISALLSLLLILAATAQGRWKRALSLGLAVFLKIQPIVFSVILMFQKRGKDLLAFLLALLVLGGLSFSFGWTPVDYWLVTMKNSAVVLDPSNHGNQSVYGFWVRWFDPATARLGFLGTLLVASIVSFLTWKKTQFDWNMGWALGLALMPVFGILTWKNTYLTWIFPLAFLIRWNWKAGLGVSLFFALTSRGFVGGELNHYFLHFRTLAWAALFFALYFLRKSSASAETVRDERGERLSLFS